MKRWLSIAALALSLSAQESTFVVFREQTYVVVWLESFSIPDGGERPSSDFTSKFFASHDELERWMAGCETLIVEEDGKTFEQQQCHPRFARDEPGILVGIYEVGARVER